MLVGGYGNTELVGTRIRRRTASVINQSGRVPERPVRPSARTTCGYARRGW